VRAAAWGAGIATAIAAAGAPVVAVSRTAEALAELANGDGTIQPGIADAGDATAAGRLTGSAGCSLVCAAFFSSAAAVAFACRS
jgi:NADP-dependent 3-hydroxy acid dehydrogenase YdfG